MIGYISEPMKIPGKRTVTPKAEATMTSQLLANNLHMSDYENEKM